MRVSGEVTVRVSGDDNQMSLFRLRDVARTVEFYGIELARVSTETSSQPRWTTMELYRTDDGRYVLSVVGHSVVYHVHESSCNSGVETPVSDVPPDAEPCPRCRPQPVDYLVDDTTTVDMEEDYPTVSVCSSTADVITRLRARRNGSVGPLSRPAMRLLKTAATIDPAFDPENVVDRL